MNKIPARVGSLSFLTHLIQKYMIINNIIIYAMMFQCIFIIGRIGWGWVNLILNLPSWKY